MDLDTPKVMLDAAIQAIQRARYMFFAVSFTCAILVSSQINGVLPWDRNVICRDYYDALHACNGDSVCEGKVAIQPLSEALTIIQVPLIGLKFSTDDMQVVGSVSLTIVMVWLYYCTRREKHAFEALVKYTRPFTPAEDAAKLAEYFFRGSSQHLVFLPRTEVDLPRLVKAMFGLLKWLPAATPLMLVAFDAWVVFLPTKIFHCGRAPLSSRFGWSDWLEVFFREMVAVICSGAIYGMCRKVRSMDKATLSTIEELRTLAGIPDDIPSAAESEPIKAGVGTNGQGAPALGTAPDANQPIPPGEITHSRKIGEPARKVK